MQTTKTLIRRRRFAGKFEASSGAHVRSEGTFSLVATSLSVIVMSEESTYA